MMLDTLSDGDHDEEDRASHEWTSRVLENIHDEITMADRWQRHSLAPDLSCCWLCTVGTLITS